MSLDVVTVRIGEKFLRRHQALYLEAALNLDVQTGGGMFLLVPFLLDTGSQFSTIPIALAQQLGISFSSQKPVGIRGSTLAHPIQGYLSPVQFCFPALPRWRFPGEWCFSPQPLTRGLLALRDILPHFAITTDRRHPPVHAAGDLLFLLREGHGGSPRS
jgi:hypothetical protein